MNPTRARDKLDEFVSLRGDIAHRGAAASGVRKKRVREFREHVERLVAATDEFVNERVNDAIGKPLF